MGLARILFGIPVPTLMGVLYQIKPTYPFIVSALIEAIAITLVMFLIKEPEVREE